MWNKKLNKLNDYCYILLVFWSNFPMPGVIRQGVSDAKLKVLGGVYKRQEAFIWEKKYTRSFTVRSNHAKKEKEKKMIKDGARESTRFSFFISPPPSSFSCLTSVTLRKTKEKQTKQRLLHRLLTFLNQFVLAFLPRFVSRRFLGSSFQVGAWAHLQNSGWQSSPTHTWIKASLQPRTCSCNSTKSQACV